MISGNFNEQQKKAIDELREMNSRSTNSSPKTASQKPESSNLLSGFNIPFLDKLKTDGDLTLIIGLLLLLLNEKADRKLLFALLYILL